MPGSMMKRGGYDERGDAAKVQEVASSGRFSKVKAPVVWAVLPMYRWRTYSTP